MNDNAKFPIIDFSRFKILLVDDTVSNLNLLRKMLEKLGFDGSRIYTKENANSTLNLLYLCLKVDEKIDLIITDCIMPGLNGLEFTAKVKKDKQLKSIPVIISSTMDSEDFYKNAINHGAIGFIPKPYNKDNVRKVISGIIGQPERKTFKM